MEHLSVPPRTSLQSTPSSTCPPFVDRAIGKAITPGEAPEGIEKWVRGVTGLDGKSYPTRAPHKPSRKALGEVCDLVRGLTFASLVGGRLVTGVHWHRRGRHRFAVDPPMAHHGAIDDVSAAGAARLGTRVEPRQKPKARRTGQ